MKNMELHKHVPDTSGVGWPRGKIVLIAFLGIAGFYLLAEHRAHSYAVLPYLLLPASLLMHGFMHRGHGGHRRHGGASSHPDTTDGQPTPPVPPAT